MSNRDVKATMQELARMLELCLNGQETIKQNGFCLFVFPFVGPEEGKTQYISNAGRADACTAMKEVLARWEGETHTPGSA
jgi:hypothetical protein